MQNTFQISKKGEKALSKKKKHYKQSISGKLRNDAAQHFKQYENNVTRASFIKNYDKFVKFCREKYDCKTKEECAEHIEARYDKLTANIILNG